MSYDEHQRLNKYISLLGSNLKPPVPEAPKDGSERLKLIREGFTHISHGSAIPVSGMGYGTGGSSANSVLLGCPFCKYQFPAIEEYGCFNYSITPYNCPNCNYPTCLLFVKD